MSFYMYMIMYIMTIYAAVMKPAPMPIYMIHQ
mgnify:CR=1 FL=1